MEKTLVFFDIDGTLVGWDRRVPEVNRTVIPELRAAGHLAVINTGRPYAHIEPMVLEMGFDGYVCACGEHILLGGKSVLRRRPEPALCRAMIELCRRCGMSPIYEAEEGMFFDYTLPLSEATARERAHYAGRFDVDFDIDTPGFCFDKFCAYEMPGCDVPGFVAGAEPYFTITGREHHMMELTVKGCSKADGIRFLSEYTGIPVERCLAIGDGRNDVAMFRACGHSAVMGDGDAGIFSEAEYVTCPMPEGGIRDALRRFGLL